METSTTTTTTTTATSTTETYSGYEAISGNTSYSHSSSNWTMHDIISNSNMHNFSSNLTMYNYIDEEEFQHAPTYLFVFVAIINVLVFCVGVFGNTLVILVICRVRAMRNPTNYFLFTLSVADLCVLIICQPVALMEFYAKERWYIGEVMCKLMPLLENGMVTVSVLTLTAMTAERFYAILYPFKQQANCSDTLAIKVIVVLWIFAYICTSPFLLTTQLESAEFYDGSQVDVCRTLIYLLWHKVFLIANSVAFFILPFVAMVYMYTQIIRQLISDSLLTQEDNYAKLTVRSRKQVVRMLIFIMVLFFVSMCPLRVVVLWQIYTPVETLHKLGIEAYYNILWVARIMMYLNSAGNPIIYCVTSTKFKMAFRRILQRKSPCTRPRYQRASSETTRVLFKKSKNKNIDIVVNGTDRVGGTNDKGQTAIIIKFARV